MRMRWIELAQYRVQGRAVVLAVSKRLVLPSQLQLWMCLQAEDLELRRSKRLLLDDAGQEKTTSPLSEINTI